MRGSVQRAVFGLCVCAAVAAMTPAVAAAQGGVWDPVAGSLPASKGGEAAPVQPDRYSAFTLDQATLADQLADAPAVGLRSRASRAAPRSS